MPLWTLHCSPGALTEDDRAALAATITDLYAILPRFYVAVVFPETGPLYLGGEPARDFVRISVDQIARTLPDQRARERWIGRINDALGPFMAERALRWEVHIDETTRELWSIQGLVPPPPGSEAEDRWARENRPSPYGPDEAGTRPAVAT